MKKLNKYIAVVAAALAATGCSTQVEPTTGRVDSDGMHTYTLRLNASIVDDVDSRAGHEWTSGDYIYIAFQNGADQIWGYANYSTYYEQWTLYTINPLPENVATGECTTWYFNNLGFGSLTSSTTQIPLNKTNVTYHDNTTYSVVNGTVVITSELSPNMGRFRMRSTEYNSITASIVGPAVPSYFSLEENTIYMTNAAVTYSTTDSGENDGYYYSDYIAGYYFADDTERMFKLHIGDYVYARSFANNLSVLAAGTSGYIDVPTPTSHDGWEMYDYVYASGSYEYYGGTTDSDVALGDNTYIFNTVTTLKSDHGVGVQMKYEPNNVYSGSLASKKEALLYVEIYDGDPDAEGATPLTQYSTVLYQPDAGYEINKTYSANISATLPSSFITTNTPQYRVYVITDGVYIRVISYTISNFF